MPGSWKRHGRLGQRPGCGAWILLAGGVLKQRRLSCDCDGLAAA